MKTVSTVLSAFLFVCLGIQTLHAQQAQTTLPLIMPPILAAAITTPGPFSFTPQSNVPRYTHIVSDEITVTGVRRAVPISITGGYYSIDNGEFINRPGEVMAGQSVRVRVISSFSSGGSSSCTLTIGRASSTFSVTTLIPPRTQNCADGELTVVWNNGHHVMWQRCDDGKYYTAEQASNYCDNLQLGGYDDWSLPYWTLMRDLLVCDIGTQGCTGSQMPSNIPTIDPVFQCSPERYWFKDIYYGVWYNQADFATGQMYVNKLPKAKTRCVR